MATANQPSACHRCGARTVKPHCHESNANCNWVKCVKCGAVSGYIFTRISGQQSVVRSHFGGVDK